MFVTTIPLRTTPQDDAILGTRFKAAQNFYNAMLGECLRRSRLMRERKAWRTAGKMPKGKDKTAAYRGMNKQFGFREYDFYSPHPIGGTCTVEQRHSWIGDHLDAHACQALAARAFKAVERSIFKGGRVRFRRFSEMRSVEGTGEKSPLHWNGKTASVIWSGLSLSAFIDPEDPVITHGIQSKVKYTRIVRMTIRGKVRFFAQLVCEGEAYKKAKHKPAVGVVGLDLGPSTIAIVGAKTATVENFCTELDSKAKQVRALQRRADRQQRAGSPHCFDAKGRWIRGQRLNRPSRQLRQTRMHAAELFRCEQAHRKNLHGRLAHRVLSLGDDVRMEKVSYKSFQRNFGKSVQFRAPGMFVAQLKATAKKWDAAVTEFPTRPTYLSQTCPKCGTVKKKKLSERQHICSCGANVQRDISSAHLARLVRDGRLDTSMLSKAWRGLCNVLRSVSKKANGAKGGASARAHPHQSAGKVPSIANAIRKSVSGPDDVAGRKAQARAGQNPVEDGECASLENMATGTSRKMECITGRQMGLWEVGCNAVKDAR